MLLRTRTQSRTQQTLAVVSHADQFDFSNAEFRMFACIAFIINANRSRAEPYAWSFEFLHKKPKNNNLLVRPSQRTEPEKNAQYLFVCYRSQHHANVA